MQLTTRHQPKKRTRILFAIGLIVPCGCGLEVKPTLAPPLRNGELRHEGQSPSVVSSTQLADSTHEPASALTSDTTRPRVSSLSEQTGEVVRRESPEPTIGERQHGQHRTSEQQPTVRPQLVAEHTTHDFGVMDPYAVASHEFVIKNIGSAPLRLSGHQSSCKCTISQYPHDPISPGDTAKVLVRWQTLANNRRFTQSATIQTNDPETPEIVFTVTGDVLVHVGANPATVQLPSIKPDEAAQTTTIVTSQVWDHFELQNLASSLEGLSWDVEPASDAELQSLKARAGYRVRLTLPSHLPQGPFTHWLRFQVKPPTIDTSGNAADLRDCEIPITGKVLRRVAVYGPGIDHRGNVQLGTISSEEGLRHRLVLKVHDSDQNLEVSRIEADPKFLQVHLTPMTGGSAGKGLYHLELIVPPNAPACRYQSTEAGTVRLQFNHPRIDELTLRVHLAVAQAVASLTSTNP